MTGASLAFFFAFDSFFGDPSVSVALPPSALGFRVIFFFHLHFSQISSPSATGFFACMLFGEVFRFGSTHFFVWAYDHSARSPVPVFFFLT